MRVLIDDIDLTSLIDLSTIQFQSALGDSIPSCDFTVQDTNSQLDLDCLSRVAVIDETAYANSTHNILANPSYATSGARWDTTVPVGSVTFDGNAGTATLACNTSSTFTALALAQTTRNGFVQPNQTYCFSCNYSITSLSNARCVISYTTYGFDGTPVTTTTTTYTANSGGTQQFVAAIDTSPNIQYITTDFELQSNTSTSVLEADTFTRADQSGFGTASNGHSWTFSGHASTSSIASNEGVIASTSGSDTSAQLGSSTTTDCEITCRVAVSSSSDIVGIQGRFAAGGGSPTTYKILWYSGAIHLNKSVSGTVTVLKQSNYSFTTGTYYNLKLRCQGTTISGKVWKDGTSEPGSWTLTTTDSAIASGGFAVLASSSTGAGCKYDHFSASSIGSATVVGNFVISNPQLELEAFPELTYPTPACTVLQANCTVLGDDTVVRQKRLFGGLVTETKQRFPDPSANCYWDIKADGWSVLLAKTLVTGNYSAQNDYFIVQDMVNTYLPNDLSTTHVQINSGVSYDQIAWQDVPMKDVFNTLAKSATGFNLWVDEYADVHYVLGGTSPSAYNLSDSPDNSTTFPYYDFEIERNATEMANRIKVFGGSDSQSVQPALEEDFNGDGSTKVFTLADIPRAVNEVSVLTVKKKVGTSGKNTFAQGYDVLVNKPSQTVTFNVAPASATGNVHVIYTAKSPVAIRMTDGQSVGTYGYTFDSKIDDSTLVTQADTYQRGLIALNEYSTPRQVEKLKTNKLFYVGDTVAITSRAKGWTSKVFVIQKVAGSVLGANESGSLVSEYALDLGVYDPTFIHHLLHLHKKVKHTSSHVSTVAVEYALAIENFTYSEAVSGTSAAGGGGGGGGTPTALTLGGLYTKSTTLSTAANMTSTVSSNGSVSGFTRHIGTATGWGEMRTSNGSGSWNALGAAGDPSGNGFIWDVTTLEGTTLQSGNWTISLRFGGISKAMTGDLLFRAYKRSASGTYTAIGTASLASQTFTSTYTTYPFSPQSMASMAFVAGDKLYCDIWLNILTNPNSSTASLSIGAVATATPADSKLSWITQGYL